jgi:hypothetical protein
MLDQTRQHHRVVYTAAKLAHCAPKQNSRRQPEPPERANGSSQKEGPLRDHPAYDQYFRLAAETELTRELYEQIQRTAKSMLRNATDMGLEQS